jgi:hypothetical protein
VLEPEGPLPETFALAAADMNDDGRVDLVVMGRDSTNVLLGDGRGGLVPAPPENRLWGGAPVVTSLDGNRWPDLVVPTYNGQLGSALGIGQGLLAVQTPVATLPGGVLAIVAADLDEDGMTDLLVLRDTVPFSSDGGTLTALIRRPDASWVESPVLDPARSDIEGVALARIDGPGPLDLVFVAGGLIHVATR